MRATLLVSVLTLLLRAVLCLGGEKPDDSAKFVDIQEVEEDYVRHPRIFHRTKGESKGTDFSADPEERDTNYWRKSATDVLKEKEKWKLQYGTARNIIFFLGDGMSIPTLVAARVEKGRREAQNGPEKSQLSFEKFPNVGLSKTYCVDSQVADSACTATAYLTGVKANFHTIGLNANVILGNCSTQKNVSNHVDSIVAWAQRKGRSTGVVTTTRVTHASPAGNYAHVADRKWEWDERITDDSEPCDDIAKQLVKSSPGKDINVVLGGGWTGFLPPSKTSWGKTGRREDEADLLKEWLDHKKSMNRTASVVFNRTALLSLDLTKTDFLMDELDFTFVYATVTLTTTVDPDASEVTISLVSECTGLFNKGHLKYALNNKESENPEPSLVEMTEAAIKLLKKNPNGFFLFVEGGEIDFGHHATKPHHAIEETLEFSKAIERAVELTSIEDTLIVVTSDHAHTMSVAGYALRGNDIFKLSGTSDKDDKPISTLSYANGPAYNEGDRPDLSKEKLDEPNYKYPVTAPMRSETHGGDDVGVFARGPWSHLFSGVIEQNVIPMAMARAGQIGPFENSSPNNAAIIVATPISMAVVLILVFLR